MYPEADKAGAASVLQVPSPAIEPASLIVSPTVVVTISLNVTATVVAVVQAAALVVAVPVLVEMPEEAVAVLTVAVEVVLGDDPSDMAISAQVR